MFFYWRYKTTCAVEACKLTPGLERGCFPRHSCSTVCVPSSIPWARNHWHTHLSIYFQIILSLGSGRNGALGESNEHRKLLLQYSDVSN